MAGEFAGKTALITGAASGIGRTTALRFAAEGARLILLDVNAAGLEQVLGEAGGAGITVCADLSNPETAAGAAREAITASGGVDYLANVAGVVRSADTVLNVNVAMWTELLTINLIAPAVLMRVAAEDMIRRRVAGRIVNVSSSSAFRPQSPACYASAKSGILGLTRSGAAEFGPYNINVNAVVPGPTLTPMVLGHTGDFTVEEMVKSGPLANLLGRPSDPEDVTSAIIYLCRPESRQITGQAIHISAGAVV
jgi:NAD(P)-dependent dehydrogenase (short-subunit alcohol dehydrogenase family)